MSGLARRTLTAGFATATALAALFPVLHGGHWFLRVAGAVLVVTLAGVVGRAGRLPRVLQPLLGLLALLGYLVVVFAHGTLDHGVLPTARTVELLRNLVDEGRADIRAYGPPVPPTAGIVLLTAAGAGAVAVVVDLLAVVLDRVALSGLALLALFAVPSAVLPGGLGGLPFVIGATGWMVLLLEEGSERVSHWGAPLRSALPGARAGGDEPSLGRVGRRIGLAALALAVVVPAVVPGLDHRLLGGGEAAASGPGGGASAATTYNPLTTLKDQLTLPTPRQLFVYSTDDPHPDYVRMTTLDRYTGSGWASSKLEADRDRARVQKGVDPPPGESPTAAHQSFTMVLAVDTDHLQVHWLPLPYGPRKVEVDGTWLWDERSQTAFSASRTTQGLRPYRVTADRVLPTEAGLVESDGESLDADVLAHYGTPIAISDAAAALAERVTRSARTAYAKAVALQRYFTDPRNGFVYDVQASLPRPHEDALDAFLSGKHGFCEQYASAMAALLRAVGVPSRVAVGFTPGQPVRGTHDVYRVTTSDAHAWPEAWFPGTGWVRFEPTPAADGASTPDYTLTSTPTTPKDPAASPRPHPRGNAFPRGLKDPETLLHPRPAAPSPAAAVGHAGRWAALFALLLLVLLGPWAVSVVRRRARERGLEPLSAWEQVREDVQDVGGPWHPADSPRAAARRLTGLLDEQGRQALERLVSAVELTRYAPAGRGEGLLADTLLADTQALRRALLASAPRSVRWRAVAAPPSTVSWLSRAVGDAVAEALDLVDRVLGAALAPLRRLLRLRPSEASARP